MRVSEGVPRGRIAELYNPDMFGEREEVIVFTRSDFNRIYNFMMDQINYISKKQMLIETGEDWKLLGHWPQIMEKVHLLDKNMDEIFKEEPLQCYLDAYLYDTIRSSKKNITVTEKEAISTINASNLNPLY